MDERLWIVVPNWERFQHYKDRDPPWIKLYTELNSDDEWLDLSAGVRGMLVTIWIEYARSRGHLRVGRAMGLCGKSARSSHLEALNHAGFIELSASRPLALARSREAETETETEKETDQREKEEKEKGTKTDRERETKRRRAVAWIDTTRAELEGVDLAYVIADEFKLHDDRDLLDELVAYANGRVESIP